MLCIGPTPWAALCWFWRISKPLSFLNVTSKYKPCIHVDRKKTILISKHKNSVQHNRFYQLEHRLRFFVTKGLNRRWLIAFVYLNLRSLQHSKVLQKRFEYDT